MLAQVVELTAQKLVWTEWLMVIVFVVGVVAWGFRMRHQAESLEGSFLAGRKVPGFIASLSTVATNLNANDFIGGAGLVYGVGVVILHGSWVNGLALLLVSLFVVQKLRRMNVFTLGGWLERRYNGTVGTLYSLTWSLVWMLFNLGLYLYAGALVLHTLVGWDLYWAIVILAFIAAGYTLLGGFGAVVATDVLQIALMFFPFVFLSFAVWMDIGSLSHLVEMVPEGKGVFWDGDTQFGPLWVMLFGIFFMGTSYWSSEAQVIQRPLSSRSEEDATISYLGATFWLSLLNPLLIAVPALWAMSKFPILKNNDFAMPSLIIHYLPPGLYGITIVGLIAGVFSSVDSQINAFCTMFTTDIYKRHLIPDRAESHYLRASRVFGVVFTFAAIGTAVLFSRAEQGMMLFAISVLATIMPPFGAITVGGALIPRLNDIGALVGLIVGMATAIGLVVAAQYDYLATIAKDTLYFRAMVAFLVTFIAVVVTSYLTAPTVRKPDEPAIDLSWSITPRVAALAILLIVCFAGMTTLWSVYFR